MISIIRKKVMAGPQGPPGTVAALSDYDCIDPQTIAVGEPLVFQPGASGVNFGTGVTTAGGTFSSFVFQKGTYQLQLTGFGFLPPFPNPPLTGLQMRIDLSANPKLEQPLSPWGGFQDAAGLLDLTPATKNVIVTTDNTVIQLIFFGAFNAQGSFNVSLRPDVVGGCGLVITRVQ